MVRRPRITHNELVNFSNLLERWSLIETSRFFRQFWRSVGMTEMQFYRRVSLSNKQIQDFVFPEITRNLKRNRFLIKHRKKHGGRHSAEKISIYRAMTKSKTNQMQGIK